MPEHWEYAALLAGCLLVTLPLELVLGARVYRQPKRLAKALLPVVVVFVVWDLVGIARDHWSYNPRFITGVDVGSMPLEELMFFFVIPICGLLTYEGVGRVLSLRRRLLGSGRSREEQDA